MTLCLRVLFGSSKDLAGFHSLLYQQSRYFVLGSSPRLVCALVGRDLVFIMSHSPSWPHSRCLISMFLKSVFSCSPAQRVHESHNVDWGRGSGHTPHYSRTLQTAFTHSFLPSILRQCFQGWEWKTNLGKEITQHGLNMVGKEARLHPSFH